MFLRKAQVSWHGIFAGIPYLCLADAKKEAQTGGRQLEFLCAVE